VPADGYWSNYWLKAPTHFGNINPRPTPDAYFSLFYASDAPWNESQFRSERFDSMLREARGLLDSDRRKAIYGDMQAMVANEAHGDPGPDRRHRCHQRECPGSGAASARWPDGLRLR
ncbi:MAG: hypothetical protein P8X50_12510, partial [Maritimibacter sp.]